MSGFRSKFSKAEGTRWLLLFGDYGDIEKFAVKECVMMLQSLLPYLLRVKSVNDFTESDHDKHLFVIGTPKNNHLLKEFEFSPEAGSEAYFITGKTSPWNPERRMISICGSCAAACLYGVEHFNTEMLGSEYVRDLPEEKNVLLESIADFSISEHPVTQERGIWTWGFPIYDYEAFIDNMARLRMNTLILWNDVAPHNMADVISYAKKRAIKVILGFHWGWGMLLDLSSREAIEKIKKHVVKSYASQYSNLEHAGIYFQTLTETSETTLNSRPRIQLVCDMVNEIGAELFKESPELKIYFGLHATSVLDNLSYLENLDPRISIIWEDAGTIPYYIEAVTRVNETSRGCATPTDTVEKTIEYSKKIAALRNKKEFKIVAKGFPNIQWSEFENHSSFILGAQTPQAVRERFNARAALWNRANALWLKNYPEALRFFRSVFDLKPEETMVTALIEDAMFEAGIQDSAALFSAMLWDPYRDRDYYLKYVANDYYRQIKLIN